MYIGTIIHRRHGAHTRANDTVHTAISTALYMRKYSTRLHVCVMCRLLVTALILFSSSSSEK